MFTYIQELER